MLSSSLLIAVLLAGSPVEDVEACGAINAIKSYLDARLIAQDKPYAALWLIEPRANASRLVAMSCASSGVEVRQQTSSPDAGTEKALVFFSRETPQGFRFDLTPGTTKPNVNYFGVLVTGMLRRNPDGSWVVEELALGRSLGSKPTKKRADEDGGR